MQYAVSDIHGCYDKCAELLRRIDLKPSDTLYVLGDMIDRGPDGLKILRDISMRPNVVPFLGNHEYAALTCLPWLLETLTEENTEPDVLLWRLKSIQGWQLDGGDVTIDEFRRLSPAARQDVLDILEDLTVYEEVTAGGREFVLVHAGLGGFSPEKSLDDYRLDELILSRPEPGQKYFEDKYLVFGHTPTPYYTGVRPEDTRIFRDGRLTPLLQLVQTAMTVFTPLAARIPPPPSEPFGNKGFNHLSALFLSAILDFVEYRLHRILHLVSEKAEICCSALISLHGQATYDLRKSPLRYTAQIFSEPVLVKKLACCFHACYTIYHKALLFWFVVLW